MAIGHCLLSVGDWLLAIGHWLVAFGYWLFSIGYWLLSMDDWLSVIGYWLLASDYWLGYWPLAHGYWLLAIGYWLLAIGYWLLSIVGSVWPAAVSTLYSARTQAFMFGRARHRLQRHRPIVKSREAPLRPARLGGFSEVCVVRSPHTKEMVRGELIAFS